MEKLRRFTGLAMLRHKLIRFLEQPTLVKDIMNGVRPWHSRSCLLAKQFLNNKNPRTLIDIGANKGDFSKAAKFYFPNIKVYQFDLNNGTGLWNKNMKMKFHKSSDESMQSTLFQPTHFKPDQLVETEVKRFDSLKIPIERPCLVKLDVEGAEYQVLEGFGDKLKEVDILQIEEVFSEFFKDRVRFSGIFKLLEKYGFRGFQQINLTVEEDMKLEKCDLLFFK
jgi:hypothetical protein